MALQITWSALFLSSGLKMGKEWWGDCPLARAAICRICHIDFSIGANEEFFFIMFFYVKFVACDIAFVACDIACDIAFVAYKIAFVANFQKP